MEMDGVLLVGVFGVGGFDVVFVIIIGSIVRDKVEVEWSRRGVLSLFV